MNRDHVGRGASQFVLRMPDGMRDEIKKLAKQNRRSMNAELLLIVEHAINTIGGNRNAAH